MKFSRPLKKTTLESKELTQIKVNHNEPHVIEKISNALQQYISPVSPDRSIIIVCIGTDRSTGDALGPLVGTQLRKRKHVNFHVYGTLDSPVHAMNLNDTLDEIDRSFARPFIIAIDACLGQVASVGCIQVCDGPVKPGAGVHKDLPEIGDIHITGIVNVGGFMEYFVLQNTRLNLVFNLAEIIATSITAAFASRHRYVVSPVLELE